MSGGEIDVVCIRQPEISAPDGESRLPGKFSASYFPINN
jgi:hypothetical protein